MHYEAIQHIAQQYGIRRQAIQAAAECSELAAALCKLVEGEGGRTAVMEEMADVIILLRQMQYLMRIDRKKLDACIARKISRQLMQMQDVPLDKSQNRPIIKNQEGLEIEWYQELYDKARRAQVAAAEDADALRQENERLRQQLHKAQCGAKPRAVHSYPN